MSMHIHLTLSERIQIELGLNQNESFKSIARSLNRDCTTISKEVKLYRISKKSGGNYLNFNDCVHAHLHTCKKKYVCTVENCISRNRKELQALDSLISPRLKQGQSLHHICTTIANEITRSEATLYTYVNNGLFTARNINMPKVVPMKPRKQPGPIRKIDRNCRLN